MCSLPWPPLCKLRTEMLLRLRNRFCNVETKSCHVHMIFRTVINTINITDHTHTHIMGHIYIYIDIYDLVPKGAQEKRTEVLENKVDRM